MDMKHANIGSTVSLILNIHKLSSDEGLPVALADLFTEEAKNCDYLLVSTCMRKRGDVDHITECTVGNCPLDDEVNKAAAEGGFPTILEFSKTRDDDQKERMGFDKVRSFGADPESGPFPTCGGGIHIGYTGWRKLWSRFKCWFTR